MANYSWFKEESNVSFRDRELYDHLNDVRAEGDWGDLVCSWYESPTKKDYMSKKLVLPKMRNALHRRWGDRSHLVREAACCRRSSRERPSPG